MTAFHLMNEEEMGKVLAEFMKGREPEVQAAAMAAADLCFVAAQAALAAHEAKSPSKSPDSAATSQLTAREKLIIGAVMYVVIHKIHASIGALGLAVGLDPGVPKVVDAVVLGKVGPT